MSIKIPTEYDNGFDFGFTAVDSEESIVEKPVVKTQDIVDSVSVELTLLKDKLDSVYNKIDSINKFIIKFLGITWIFYFTHSFKIYVIFIFFCS
jgi:hypothetical protein